MTADGTFGEVMMWDELFILGQIVSLFALSYGAWLCFIHRDVGPDDARLMRRHDDSALAPPRERRARRRFFAGDDRRGAHSKTNDRSIA
jgi:hypothetical protein